MTVTATTASTSGTKITSQTDQMQPHDNRHNTNKSPRVHNFTTVRTDSLHNAGGGLFTLIRDNITFTKKRPLIHTILKFKWSRDTLTTLYISQLQTFIYLIVTAHPPTTNSWNGHTPLHTVHHKHTTLQSSPEMWTHTPLSGTLDTIHERHRVHFRSDHHTH